MGGVVLVHCADGLWRRSSEDSPVGALVLAGGDQFLLEPGLLQPGGDEPLEGLSGGLAQRAVPFGLPGPA